MTLYKTLTYVTSASPESSALNVLLKTFTQLMDARKSRFAPNTPDPDAPKAQDT